MSDLPSFPNGHEPAPPGDDPSSWERWIDAIGPASMLVVIGSRMGPLVRDAMTAEDVWQETLLRAWRSRRELEWRGQKSFRRWLLQIAERCIWDASDSAHTIKRGGGNGAVAFSNGSSGTAEERLVLTSTTPSRLALEHERARVMAEALERLSDDVRDVVRLRLFEDLTSEEVAERLGMSVSTVKHRFRKGATEYQRRLASAFSTRGALPQDRSARQSARARPARKARSIRRRFPLVASDTLA